jgi:glycosyltransferase involved in cell wall biosynthesis
VIACSHYMREQIADIFGVEEERISVIPNGIDPDDLPPRTRRAERLRPSSPRPRRSSCC